MALGLIQRLYETLHAFDIVANSEEFSECWLGMECSYYRGLRHKQSSPSTTALARCAVRLENTANAFKHSTMPQIAHMAHVLAELSEGCWLAIRETGGQR